VLWGGGRSRGTRYHSQAPRPLFTYHVEKYYRLKASLTAAFSDPGWLDRAQANLTPDDRQALWCAMLMASGQMLVRAAKQYQAMDATTWESLVRNGATGMISMRVLGEEQYRDNLRTLRDTVVNQEEKSTEGGRYVLLISALPGIWDAPK
ncbi:hypothetical protein, partial [Sulfobacillus harzensis]